MRCLSKARRALAAVVLLGALLGRMSPALADDIARVDYFLNHRSIEPVYRENGLDPTVLIHVREVVLKGRERTAPGAGKVLLLLHGAATPGYVGFDGACEGCSMMRHFARAGWDVFTLDYEGFGLSTRSPVMDAPELFPDAAVPTSTEVAVDDIARVVDFIRDLRGVAKVNLLGWSFGAIRSGPIYTIARPDTVARLVLFAGEYGRPSADDKARAEASAKQKVLTTAPSLAGWVRFGGTAENFLPGAVAAYRDAILASDPKSGELGGKFRFPAGPLVDIWSAEVQFDAARITVPTLVIRGANDIVGSAADNQRLLGQLGSEIKEFVEIPEGSHYIFFEKAGVPFYDAVLEFLEEGNE